MNPWYKGFNGLISSTERKNTNQNTAIFDMKGTYIIDEDQEDVIEITELPVGRWTLDYKNYLEKLS